MGWIFNILWYESDIFNPILHVSLGLSCFIGEGGGGKNVHIPILMSAGIKLETY